MSVVQEIFYGRYLNQKRNLTWGAIVDGWHATRKWVQSIIAWSHSTDRSLGCSRRISVGRILEQPKSICL
jgi:hypothetical protein